MNHEVSVIFCNVLASEGMVPTQALSLAHARHAAAARRMSNQMGAPV